MRKLTIWVLDSGLGSAITGPIDVLTVANSIWAHRTKGKAQPLFEWAVESLDGAPVRTASGVVLEVDGAINPEGSADVLLLSGIYTQGGSRDVLRSLGRLRPLIPALRELHSRGTLIAANCTSTFLLAEAGLLDRQPATTSWWLAKAFQQRYPLVDLKPDEILTEAGGLLCSGAITAYLNLALRIVEKFGGASLARSTARTMLIDSNRLSQAAHKILSVQEHIPHSDPVVIRTQRYMERRLSERFSLERLAGELSVSERTLLRRFKKAVGDTPLHYLQAQRIDLAKRLLETTALAIGAVGERVGYGDVGAFRRIFRRETGLSPREFQRAFARRRSNARAPKR